MTKIDALILGCTQYPIFEEIIKEEMPNTDIINTGKIIANYLDNNLDKSVNKINIEDEVFLTDVEGNFLTVAKKLLNYNIKIKKVEVKY